VLLPGGRFVLLEHVRSPVRPVRGVQRLLAPALLRFGADHVLREPLELVRAEGFWVESIERSKLGLVSGCWRANPTRAERESARAALSSEPASIRARPSASGWARARTTTSSTVV
jgi:hypothetical protein